MKKTLYIGIVTMMLLPISALAQTTASPSSGSGVTNVSGTAVPTGQSEFNTSATAETPPSYVLISPLPCIGVTNGSNGTTCTNANGTSEITSIGIQSYLLYLFKLLISFAVFLAVIMIIYGGFKYMSTEAIAGKGDARKTIENAIYGLLLALTSYLILYTINPNLVNLSEVAVPKLNVAASQSLQNSINNLTAVNTVDNSQYVANNASIQSAINANAAAIATEQSAEQNMNTLSGELYSDGCIDQEGNDISGGDPDCTTLENQYQTAQNTADTAVAEQATQQAIGNMINAANQLNTTTNGDVLEGDTNISDAQTAIQSINNTFNQAWSSIPNGDASDKQAITNQMTYDEASVVNTYNTNTVLANLAEDQYNGISDPDSIAAANTLIQTLETNSIPNQTDSDGLITGQIGTLSPTSTLGQQYAAANQAKITALKNAVKAAGGTPAQ